ncbi:hypothetical protein DFP72DRAFT_1153461 [Ephemerocybe angulata]|uniref:Uncharacterized protein n=1 Tax=Ephemerocybe angulata TaxID=980116 RepID=A0A8H6HHA0_9AGAR|nr:hypothetical protein DFP72DRAFT_1153461 [Tulosesus angulatus]
MPAQLLAQLLRGPFQIDRDLSLGIILGNRKSEVLIYGGQLGIGAALACAMVKHPNYCARSADGSLPTGDRRYQIAFVVHERAPPPAFQLSSLPPTCSVRYPALAYASPSCHPSDCFCWGFDDVAARRAWCTCGPQPSPGLFVPRRPDRSAAANSRSVGYPLADPTLAVVSDFPSYSALPIYNVPYPVLPYPVMAMRNVQLQFRLRSGPLVPSSLVHPSRMAMSKTLWNGSGAILWEGLRLILGSRRRSGKLARRSTIDPRVSTLTAVLQYVCIGTEAPSEVKTTSTSLTIGVAYREC